MADQNLIDNTQKNPDDWTTGGEPMTGAQKSHIETLSGHQASSKMSKADASKLIDKLHKRHGLNSNQIK